MCARSFDINIKQGEAREQAFNEGKASRLDAGIDGTVRAVQ